MNHKRSFISIVLATIVVVSLCAVSVSSASVSAADNVGGTSVAKTAGVASSPTPSGGTVGVVPELSWTQGQPFPVVNGLTIYPTLYPTRAPSGPYVEQHWYAGSVWHGPDQSARTTGVTITVPQAKPLTDEFYYVLLSAWDSAGSYNQIGFSDTGGTWGLTYSWTTGDLDHIVYHYSSNAMALTVGATYTFVITTEGGTTHFIAYQGSAKVWSIDAPTGGNNLILDTFYLNRAYGYTDYEEIWDVHAAGGSPAFDFYFNNNYWVPIAGGKNAPSWTTWSTSLKPSGVAVTLNGNGAGVLCDNPQGGWGKWESLGGGIKDAPAVSTWAPYSISLELFARGTDNALYQRSYDQIEGMWMPWKSLSGSITSGPAAVSTRAAYMWVYGRGTDGALWARWSGDWTSTWTPWHKPIAGSLLAGTGPGVCSAAADTQDLFVTGTDGAVYWSHWTNTAGYTPWKNLGGKLTSSPAVVSPAPGYLYVYGRGGDGALWARWSGNGGSTWTLWYKPLAAGLLGGTSAGGNKALVNTQDLLVTGTDSVPYWSYWTLYAGYTPFWSIGGKLTSSPAASDLYGTVQVFGRGSDGAVWWTGRSS